MENLASTLKLKEPNVLEMVENLGFAEPTGSVRTKKENKIWLLLSATKKLRISLVNAGMDAKIAQHHIGHTSKKKLQTKFAFT